MRPCRGRTCRRGAGRSAAAQVEFESERWKEFYNIIVSSADSTGAFTAGVDTVNQHRPTVERADDVGQQLLALVVPRQVAARIVRRDQRHQLDLGNGLGISRNRGPEGFI